MEGKNPYLIKEIKSKFQADLQRTEKSKQDLLKKRAELLKKLSSYHETLEQIIKELKERNIELQLAEQDEFPNKKLRSFISGINQIIKELTEIGRYLKMVSADEAYFRKQLAELSISPYNSLLPPPSNTIPSKLTFFQPPMDISSVKAKLANLIPPDIKPIRTCKELGGWYARFKDAPWAPDYDRLCLEGEEAEKWGGPDGIDWDSPDKLWGPDSLRAKWHQNGRRASEPFDETPWPSRKSIRTKDDALISPSVFTHKSAIIIIRDEIKRLEQEVRERSGDEISNRL